MIWFLFAILLCALAGCSEYSSDFDVVDARAKDPVSQTLNVDYFGVDINYYRWEMCSSMTYERDSIALECLDSSFNVVSRITDYDTAGYRNQTAVFKDLKLQSPFVEIVQYGHLMWKYGVQMYSVSVEMRNLRNAVNMDTVRFNESTDVLIRDRLRRYLEEGLPFYVAEGMAKKDFKDFLKSKNLSASFIFCNALKYPETENVQRHLEKFQREFALDTLSKDSPILTTLDSMLTADSVIPDCNMDYLALAYDFNQCSRSNYVDSIMNPYSKWYGTVLYCDSSKWRIIPRDGLPLLCMTYNKDELRLTKDSAFVVCDGNGSWRDAAFKEPYLTRFLGKCDSSETSIDTLGHSALCAADGKWYIYKSELERQIGICGVNVEFGTTKVLGDTAYYCNSTGEKWIVYSELERQIGICGITAKYDSIAEYEDGYYSCTKAWADNRGVPGVWNLLDAQAWIERTIGKCCSTIPCGTLASYGNHVYYCEDKAKKWRDANSREFTLFTHPNGGNCNRNSSHIQVVPVNDEGYWMCVDDPVGGIDYGWTRLDRKNHKELTTYFNNGSGESTKVVAVDLSTKYYNYALYLNGDRDDSSLYGVVYPLGFYEIVLTDDLLLLDRPVDGVIAADENCPIGFHVEETICVKSRTN